MKTVLLFLRHSKAFKEGDQRKDPVLGRERPDAGRAPLGDHRGAWRGAGGDR